MLVRVLMACWNLKCRWWTNMSSGNCSESVLVWSLKNKNALDSVLQLWPVGAQWMWEDHTSEMHRGYAENLAGSHYCVGEAPCVPWSWRAREDGGIHAAGKHHILKCVFQQSKVHLCVLHAYEPGNKVCIKAFLLLLVHTNPLQHTHELKGP